jgi:hypothetical protein
MCDWDAAGTTGSGTKMESRCHEPSSGTPLGIFFMVGSTAKAFTVTLTPSWKYPLCPGIRICCCTYFLIRVRHV